jgi:hypothetical protein
MFHQLAAMNNSLRLFEVYLVVGLITFFGLTFLGIWFNGKEDIPVDMALPEKDPYKDKLASIIGAAFILAFMWLVAFFVLTYGFLSTHLTWTP